jgi:hypothetical protein
MVGFKTTRYPRLLAAAPLVCFIDKVAADDLELHQQDVRYQRSLVYLQRHPKICLQMYFNIIALTTWGTPRAAWFVPTWAP